MLRMRLRDLAFACLLASVVSTACAADAADFSLKKVADGVYAAIVADGSRAGGNSGFIIGTNGVVVVDTFIDAAPARHLLEEIRKLTRLPVRYVVNTHYHIDHTGGNAVFAQEGATILAQRNVRSWLHTENLKFFGPNPKPEARARVEALVLPDVVFDQAVDIFLGARAVQVRYLPGHTGGDAVVVVPDADVVFTGDLFWEKHLPNLIDATTDAWVRTLDQLLARHPSARFVSGHGDVGTFDAVRDFRQYLVDLRGTIAQARADGRSGQALEDAVLPRLRQKYAAWGYFEAFSKRNIAQTAAELSGQKQVPAADAGAQ